MIYRHPYCVNSHDVDYKGEVRASRILMYMQETANYQMEALHPSNDELRERGLSFVLSRVAISYYHPLRAHENIEVQTWACEPHGMLTERCFRILRDGAVVAEALTLWGLIRLEDRRPVRISEVGSDYQPEAPLELDLPRRFVLPPEAPLRLMGEHTVAYCETDQNCHMNNTCYPDMFCDYLDLTDTHPASVVINYNTEAPLHTSLRVYRAEYDGAFFFRTLREDGKVNAEAKIILD